MKENIVDFNQFKAMKEAKSKNNADDFLPDFPDDMDMEEFDSDSMDSLTGAVTGLFSRIMTEASEYENFDDYINVLEESVAELKKDEPKSKKSRKFFAWLSQLVNEEMTYHLAQSISQILHTGMEAIAPKIPLLMEGKIPESELGIKLPLETGEDVMAVNARIEEILQLEHRGEATEKDIDTKTTLLAILVLLSRQLLEEYHHEEPRKARKSHHRKWEEKVRSVRFNLNSFYYLCGSSFSNGPSDDTSVNTLLENSLDFDIDEEEYPGLTSDDIYDFIYSVLENGADDDYEDYDDDDDYDDEDFYFDDNDDDDDDDD